MLQNLLYNILMVYFLNNVVVLVMHRYESKRLSLLFLCKFCKIF